VPWLQHLNEWLRTLQEQNQPAVLACSALKHAYRRLLAHGLDSVCFVYLHGSFDLIYRRMEARQGHYMSEEMLQSQFDALEPPGPGEALHVDVTPPVSRIVRGIEEALHSGDGCRSPS
jgi:gluconokinase